MGKRKNKFHILVLVIFIMSFLIFLFTLYLNYVLVLEKKEITTTLNVGNSIAFDLNDTDLTFGTIVSDSSSQRNLIIENNYDFPIKLEFDVKGDIKRFLILDKIVYLDIGEKKSVGINALTLVEEDVGNYSGKIIITVRKA